LLEVYSAVCYYTFRKFGGELSDVPIYAVAPRPDISISDPARRFYESLNVIVVDAELNVDYADYPLANKPICAAYVAAICDTEFLAWMDSDTLVINEPKSLILDDSVDVCAAPESVKGVGSFGKEDILADPYWMQLYDICGTMGEPYTLTGLTGERIRAYYNTGVIASRRSSGIFEKWRDNMSATLDRCLWPYNPKLGDHHRHMVEQTTFGATAHSHEFKIAELPYTHNYWVQNQGYMMANYGVAPLDAAIWHHTNRMEKAFANLQRDIDRKGYDLTRIEEFVADIRQNSKDRLGLDISWHRKMRQRLKIGPRLRRLVGRSLPSDQI